MMAGPEKRPSKPQTGALPIISVLREPLPFFSCDGKAPSPCAGTPSLLFNRFLPFRSNSCYPYIFFDIFLNFLSHPHQFVFFLCFYGLSLYISVLSPRFGVSILFFKYSVLTSCFVITPSACSIIKPHSCQSSRLSASLLHPSPLLPCYAQWRCSSKWNQG